MNIRTLAYMMLLLFQAAAYGMTVYDSGEIYSKDVRKTGAHRWSVTTEQIETLLNVKAGVDSVKCNYTQEAGLAYSIHCEGPEALGANALTVHQSDIVFENVSKLEDEQVVRREESELQATGRFKQVKCFDAQTQDSEFSVVCHGI